MATKLDGNENKRVFAREVINVMCVLANTKLIYSSRRVVYTRLLTYVLNVHLELTEAEWRKYASVNWATIDLDNVLALVKPHRLNQCWIIVRWALGTIFSEILIKIQQFFV